MHILYAESLLPYNTLALPGKASALAQVSDVAELLEALAWAEQHTLPVIPLGEGSNVVIADDLQALVLHLQNRGREVLDESDDHVLLRIQAGENWHALVDWSLGQDYHGLENLALIPGTVGAAPIQNIGAYGVELDTLVEAVHAMSVASGERLTLTTRDCEFAYRDSVFKGRLRDQLIIVAVDLKLARQPQLRTGYPALADYLDRECSGAITSRDIFDAVVSIRRSRLPDPALEPNAGSFFKNPVVSEETAAGLRQQFPALPGYPQSGGRVKLPAAWLIENCGWKGGRAGNVGMHPDHALVLVNYGGASGSEVLAFAALVAESVRERFGVNLEIEPRIYGGPS